MKKRKISLVFSGGAIYGAAEIGFLEAIMEKFDYDDFEIITGTSVGSLNGSITAQRDVDKLFSIWSSLKKPHDLFKRWPFGIVQGFFKGALYNFDPTKKLIDNSVDTDKLIDSPIRFFACSVDRINEKTTYTENTADNTEVLKAQILASASIPFTFPPVKIAGQEYVDGGVREPIPVEKAVMEAKTSELCLILSANPLRETPHHNPHPNLYQVAMDSVDTMFHEIFHNDLKKGTEKYWKDKKFIILAPEHVYFNSSFDVDQEKIAKTRAECAAIARKALKKI